MVEEVEDKEVGRTLLVGMAATVLQFVVAGTILMRRSLLYAAADFKKMIFCSLPVTILVAHSILDFSALISGQRAEVFREVRPYRYGTVLKTILFSLT